MVNKSDQQNCGFYLNNFVNFSEAYKTPPDALVVRTLKDG